MATPQVSENPEVQQNYLASLALGAAVAQSVEALWSATQPLATAEAMTQFSNGLFIVAGQLGGVAASLGEDYYRGIRREAGITTTVKLPEPKLPPRSQIDANIAWATRERPEPVALAVADISDMQAAILADMQASTEKAVLDVMRTRVVEAVEGDEEALGFRRVPRPDACYWCITLAIRSTTRRGLASDWAGSARDPRLSAPGAAGGQHYGVYKTRKSAGQMPAGAAGLNRFHTHCHCVVEPVFAPADSIPDWLADLETLYADSTVNSAKGESLNDFRKALRAHRNGEEPQAPEAPVSLPTSSPTAAQIVAILDRLDSAMAA
ncbi:MAG: hypothetical protein ACRDTJ_04405 [Pseudonocardiaceae bacterium]